MKLAVDFNDPCYPFLSIIKDNQDLKCMSLATQLLKNQVRLNRTQCPGQLQY